MLDLTIAALDVTYAASASGKGIPANYEKYTYKAASGATLKGTVGSISLKAGTVFGLRVSVKAGKKGYLLRVSGTKTPVRLTLAQGKKLIAAAGSVATPAAKPASDTPAAEDAFPPGATVKALYAGDGAHYTAKVVQSKGNKVQVDWADGGGKAWVKLTDIKVPKPKAAKAPSSAPSTPAYSAGQSVHALYDDGEHYGAKVLAVEGDEAQVAWEDGTEPQWVKLSDLKSPPGGKVQAVKTTQDMLDYLGQKGAAAVLAKAGLKIVKGSNPDKEVKLQVSQPPLHALYWQKDGMVMPIVDHGHPSYGVLPKPFKASTAGDLAKWLGTYNKQVAAAKKNAGKPKPASAPSENPWAPKSDTPEQKAAKKAAAIKEVRDKHEGPDHKLPTTSIGKATVDIGGHTFDWSAGSEGNAATYLKLARDNFDIKGLPADKMAAVRSYKSTSGDVNNLLRHGKTVLNKEKVETKIKLMREMIDAAPLKQDTPIYRGSDIDKELFNKLLAGEVSTYEDKGFMSVSICPNVAHSFVKDYDDGKPPLMLRTVLPKGYKALPANGYDMDPTSGNEPEHEFVLAPGTKFKVKGMAFDPDLRCYVLDVEP